MASQEKQRTARPLLDRIIFAMGVFMLITAVGATSVNAIQNSNSAGVTVETDAAADV